MHLTETGTQVLARADRLVTELEADVVADLGDDDRARLRESVDRR